MNKRPLLNYATTQNEPKRSKKNQNNQKRDLN